MYPNDTIYRGFNNSGLKYRNVSATSLENAKSLVFYIIIPKNQIYATSL